LAGWSANEARRRHLDTVRSDSSVDYLTPEAFAAKIETLTAAPTTAADQGAKFDKRGAG
jgi:hypothetical protein